MGGCSDSRGMDFEKFAQMVRTPQLRRMRSRSISSRQISRQISRANSADFVREREKLREDYSRRQASRYNPIERAPTRIQDEIDQTEYVHVDKHLSRSTNSITL